MDFAKKQLEKYGWKEGEGLGKNKKGITKALKPKLKFDTGGLGFDLYEDVHNSWWQRVYDEAAKNIITKKAENGSVILETVGDSVEVSTKKKKKRRNDEFRKGFIKTSELSDSIERRVIEEEEQEEVKKKKMTSGICDLTDEELFRVCGGRTAHKGARHGVKMSAKLSRIEHQELNLLHKLPINNAKDVHIMKKKKKIR